MRRRYHYPSAGRDLISNMMNRGRRILQPSDWWGENQDLQIRIYNKAYSKMWHYVQASPGEVSGWGKVKVEGNNIIITDICILKQTCTGGDTVINEEVMGNFLYKLAKNNQDPSEWRLWWHSHHNFETFWSPTDIGTIDKIVNMFDTFLVSTCMNKMGSLIGRLDEVNKSTNIQHMNEELPIHVLPTYGRHLAKRCQRQVKRLVKMGGVIQTGYDLNNNYINQQISIG